MQENTAKFDAIIFDVDGTLWDSVEEIRVSWQVVLDAQYPNLRPPLTTEEIWGCMGQEITDVAKKLFPMLTPEQHAPLLRAAIEEEHDYLAKVGATSYPQMRETLVRLAEKYPLAIVSNCEDGYIQNFLSFTNLQDHITDFESHGKTGLSKAENIQLVINRNGFSRPCYVGDTALDQEACKKIGVPFIYASYGFGVATDYMQKIDSLPELLDFLL